MLFNSFYEGKRVLITGHTGFKGSWLAMWLNKLGAKVVGYALDPPFDYTPYVICNLDKEIDSVIADIRDLKTLKEVFLKYQPEIVFHLAAQALVRYSYREPVKTYETNIMGTINLFEACRSTPSVKAIVNITSDKCYENRKLDRGYKENDPLGGYDPYSSSKGCAELITNAYRNSYFNPDNYNEHTVSIASARAGNVIGGGDWAEDRLVPDCMRALIQNRTIHLRYPNSIRPWQHVLDPLYGYLMLGQFLYQEGSAFSGAWNFGPNDENAKPVKWVVEYISKKWGSKSAWETIVRDHPHEAIWLKLDSSRAKSKLGWHPQWDLKISLEKTVEWYQAYCKRENMLAYTLSQIQSYENNFTQ